MPPPAMTDSNKALIAEFVCAALLLLALGGFFLGFSGSVDDAHITYWAAETLHRFGHILNYNLEPVEQSSALLQVVVLGLLSKASGLSVVGLGHVTTMIVAIATLFFTAKLSHQHGVVGGVSLLLASSPFFVYWAFGGMEGPWLALLLVLLLLQLPSCLLRNGVSITVALLSLAIQMTRPEMPIVMCAFAVSLLLSRLLYKQTLTMWTQTSLGRFLALQVLCAVGFLAWRWWYFGDGFPQPVSAKSSGLSFAAALTGLQYFSQTWLTVWLAPMLFVFTIGVVRLLRREDKQQSLPLMVLLILYVGFVIASGGDWMAAGRFWAPVMPFIAVAVLVALGKSQREKNWRRGVLAFFVIANTVYLWRGTAIDFNGVPLWKKTALTSADHVEQYSFFERHARENLHDIATLAYVQPLVQQLLMEREKQRSAAPITIMAGQMGMVPFHLSQQFAGHLRFIDRNGITERTLTRCDVANVLPRTRNGIGVGYEWIVANSAALEKNCSFVMPDIVFDIETAWNRHNITALQQAGYVFVYRQRGHIFDEPKDAWLPLRKIGAGQFIAVSQAVWQQLGKPNAVKRNF
jgi:hypothetical protein